MSREVILVVDTKNTAFWNFSSSRSVERYLNTCLCLQVS